MLDKAESNRRRWPRTEQFELSPDGVRAEESYRSLVVASRSVGGRASFDAARAEWAESLHVAPGDGAYLAEVRSGPVSLHEIVDALEACGETRKDATEALGRLFDVGLIVKAAPK
jgi:hypothetical protein